MTMSHLRMPALSDGIDAMNRWMKSLPFRQQAKTLKTCRILTPSDGSLEGPVVSVPNAAVAIFEQHGGRLETTLPSPDGWESISFDELPDRLQLQPSHGDNPASSFLILAEDQDSDSFAELLSALTLIRSKHQQILTLESATNECVTAIELIGTDPLELTDGSLGPIRVLQVRDLGVRAATPLGLIHPMVEATPDLIRINHVRNSTLIWRSDPTDDRKGAFVSMSVREQRTRIPADLFIIVPERFPATSPNNQITPPSIEIHLERSRSLSENEHRPTSRVLLELRDSSNGPSMRRLLDIMDEVESGVLHEDTLIWTSRLGAGEASPTTHHICFRTDRPASEFASRGVRAFAQPEAFHARSIPLFIEAGYSLRPAIDSLLETLPAEHPLLRQLTDEFPAEVDGCPCHHFLRVNPHGAPSHQVLQNGEKLMDHISTIVAEMMALPAGESTDAAVSLELAERVRAERERNLKNIRVAGEEESALVRDEFDSALADLARHIDAVEARLAECAEKSATLSEVTTSLEDGLTKTPRDWWTLHETVEEINRKIIEPRAAWLKKIDSEQKDFHNGQDKIIKELANAEALASSRLASIKSWLAEAEEARSELNRVLRQVQAVQKKLALSVEQATKDHREAALVLKAASSKLDREAQRLAESERRLARDQQAIVNRRHELEAKKSRQAETERQIQQRSVQIDGEFQQLSNRKVALEAEIHRLDNLEKHEIPNLDRSCESLQKRLNRFDKAALEQKSQSLAQRQNSLNANLQSLQRQEEELLRQEEEGRQKEELVREGTTTIQAREAELKARRRKLDSKLDASKAAENQLKDGYRRLQNDEAKYGSNKLELRLFRVFHALFRKKEGKK